MVYDDVIKNGWNQLLPAKAKYTKRDMDKVYIASFLDRNLNHGQTFTPSECRFIVICTAIFHDATYSKSVSKAVR